MTRLTGFEAIEMKRKNEEVELNKYNDPTEEERFDISISAAEEVASEDPNLIYADVDGEIADREERWWDWHNKDDSRGSSAVGRFFLNGEKGEIMRAVVKKHPVTNRALYIGPEKSLRFVDLREADLCWADLRWTDLYKADLRRAYLRGADLRRADLREADLREADLREADLHGACFYGARFGGADLRGAELYAVDLHGTELETDCYD
jgi:uncharacterized protein YjbI with pentapeptide repeats